MDSLNQPQTGMQLYDAEGRRLYLTEDERRAFIAAAAKAPHEVRTFCGVLHATGCRISEALALRRPRRPVRPGDCVREPEEAEARRVPRRAVSCPSYWTRATWYTASGR